MTNNNSIFSEIQSAVFADQKGYWKARGYEQFPGWEAEGLPFQDFYELLDGNHKKMWLDQSGKLKDDRLVYQGESLLPLYKGMIETVRTVVGTGFFIYSALIVNLHIKLAYYGRKLNCEASVKAVIDQGDAAATKDISNRALALRLAAYIIYEGDGLGGYKDRTWLLWGRLKGIACPDNPEILSLAEAAECHDEYRQANPHEQKAMFIEWWNEISDAHAAIDPVIVGHIFNGYRCVCRYQLMESPFCPPKQMFDPGSNVDVQAAICGLFRRSAKGIGEGASYDPNDLDNPAHRFADMLDSSYAKFKHFLTGADNKLTDFGDYLITVHRISLVRNDCVDEIVKRDLLTNEEQNELEEFGFKLKVNKRGRRRR